ncbi:contractile injection system tape measure protein [Photorhabdus akhurstii]|uniref:contractile injection system tape measure protein n=1 Tax=Photorhabdus akhurstii TaxID=171438 RepID=UPI0015E328A0
MPWEPNLLNRITITIEANNQQAAKKVLHGSLLNQADINKLFNTFFTQYPINQDIYLETLTLDLGEISLHNFNSLFPVRLNTALNKALSQYQINHQEKKTSLTQSKSQKITKKSSLLHVNNSINIEDFIHYLNQKNSAFNSIEIKTHHQNIDTNIRKLVNQLTGIEDKWVLFLAKSCLSEQNLQRLLALKQSTLLSAINHRLSARINRSQYLGEPVSPGQLILNALQYIQLNNTQEIPKLDAKVLLHITTELDSGILNAESIIPLFRQIITYNTPLNSWLKQIWQTITVAKLSKKYLSDKEYQYLSEHFISNSTNKDTLSEKSITINHNNINPQENQYLPDHSISNYMDKNRLSKKSIITNHNNINPQEEQYLSGHYSSNHTNKDTLGKKSVITNHDNINTQEEQYLLEHFISNHTDKDRVGEKLIITNHDNINPQENQYLPEHSISNHTNKDTFGKKLIATNHDNINVKEDQYTPKHFISGHADRNKSSKKLTAIHVDIKNVHRYEYSTNQEVISKNQRISPISNNRHITGNNTNQLQNINKTHSEYVRLPKQTLPYQVNNAGILVLWPMLPALFNQFGLLEEQKFIHRQAPFSAINFLNYLIWGNEEIQTELNILNNVLCGLMVNEPIELAPIEPEKQLIIDQWLDAIISQLPGWKKLTRNDARQLFLQRPGELLISDQEINITVEHQPFDVLLTDWPWPLNIAKLPWLDHPLKIDWKNI